MEQRNPTRYQLTQLSYRAMWGILGRGAPRRLRRHFGRLYAKEAYRQHKGLPLRYTQGSALVDMIVKEFERPKDEQSIVVDGEAGGLVEGSSRGNVISST